MFLSYYIFILQNTRLEKSLHKQNLTSCRMCYIYRYFIMTENDVYTDCV